MNLAVRLKYRKANSYEKIENKFYESGPVYLWRRITASWRTFPDFIIIGSQKCGTTSLYNYLLKHPNILSSSRKEVKYFDMCRDKDLMWYKSQFPLKCLKKINKYNISGEATPDYFFFNDIPEIMFNILPNVKLILVLRNPVERAYSQYNYSVKRGFEDLDFFDALKEEESRITNIGLKRNNIHYREFSYKKRGLYYEQLLWWLKYYNKKQIFIIDFDDLKFNTNYIMKKTYKFLEIPNLSTSFSKQFNSGVYSQMSDTAREYLVNYFKNPNDKLFELLGYKFNWQ